MTEATLYPAFGPRPWVFGVLNVTPDSFSDGGRWDRTELAVQRGRQLSAQGADVVDVGGESTRPGSHRIDADTEAARVISVIRELSAQAVLCSIDTTRATVAAAALDAGAVVINDVSGGLADPDMARVAAGSGVPWILMHWRGHSQTMHEQAHYVDVVREVREELLRQVDHAVAAGVDERSLILDPGLGFAKNAEHNWELLRRLDELVELGLPVLVGASRKGFLGQLLADPDGEVRPPSGREAATAAVSLLSAQRGVWGVRVHEPVPTRDAFATMAAAAVRRPDAVNTRWDPFAPVEILTDDLGAQLGHLRRPGRADG
ncbi:dihydropteroate synthase [Nakamurella panacisegetis]|uniref:Dihydropteroate synthase n=1 Tax=Nakamurella panacisegetis TaxID=1090615 RepID=A0A1H0NPS0_9ACTN|nr:dihydropteroate synthase [Nakamurella panacisegetis]SDO94360.1 dihydropteroate synthase [Nakamurella panacisegetis]